MGPHLPLLGRRFFFHFIVLQLFILLFSGKTALAQCPPIITANPPGASVCMGDSVTLTCQPSSAVTWQWYQNGFPIPGATANTYYAKTDGNYTVMVSGCALPSNPITVVMKPLPLINITSNVGDSICTGQSVTLTVTTGPNVQWVYLQPAGMLGQTTNPYTGTLTVTTTFQVVGVDQTTTCANTAMLTIPVVPPILPGSISPNDTVCFGGTPGFITGTPATGSNNTFTYQWQVSTISGVAGFNNIPGATGLSYQPGPVFTDTWFRRRVSAPPCPDMYTNAVMVRVIPPPMVTSIPTWIICSGNSVNYTPVSNVPGTTFTWTAAVTSGTVLGLVPSGSGPINTVLSVPAGTSTPGVVTYTITPTGPATSYCPGITSDVVVTIQPTPVVSNAVMNQAMCAGTVSTPVVLQTNVTGTTFSWSAVATPGLLGYVAAGTGDIPAMQIFSNLMGVGTVTYTIIPTGPAPYSCAGTPATYTITVNPSPTVTNNPMDQTICSGSTSTAITLTSNVVGTTFTWTANAVPPGMTGFQASGTNTIPAQTINNPTTSQGVVTYSITPSGNINGCVGIPRNYYIYVNPVPVAVATPGSQTICSGMTTGISLTSGVANTTFSWTASAPSSINGFSDGTGSVIAQTLTNTSNAPHDVTYVITPTANGCVGNDITVVVTVVPAPTLTVNPVAVSTCSGNPMVINLTASLPGVSFDWTASATGNVTGYSNGSGPAISQTLINNDNVPRDVVYAVMMSLSGCIVGPDYITVTVYPVAQVTNTPLSTSRCSGSALVLSLTSNVTGTTFTWTANGTPGISGYSNGSGNTINQTFLNSGTTPGTVTYTITPTAYGCVGVSSNYTVTVNPIPNVNFSLANQSICSGTNTTPVILSSSVAGTTFSWTATPSAGGITGYTASGNGNIPSQTINSSLTIQGNVTYTAIPTNSGCTGVSGSHVVTINPLPLVTNPMMNQAICSGSTTTNVNLVSNVAGTTFSWVASPSSGSITGYQASGTNTIPPQTILNGLTTPGTVTYLVTPTSNFGPACTGVSANYITTINPIPSVTSSLTAAVCSGQPFTYLITSNLAGTTFNWTRAAVPGISNPPSSGTSANIAETLINLTGSDINVTYVLQPYGQAPTICAGVPQNLVVTVRALPQVNAGTDLTIPYGTSTSITGTATGGTGSLGYVWTPNAYIASGANTLVPQTINLNSDRSYTLTVTDAAGCINSDVMTVFVTGSPIAANPTATPSTICWGETTILNANATGGSGTYTYLWSSTPAGFSSTSSTVTVSPIVNTVYTVVINDGFNIATASVSVTVNPLPVQYLVTGGGEYCTGGPGIPVGLSGTQAGVTYQLYNNGNPVGSPISGTGGAVSFGNQTLAGIYAAVATRTATGCINSMGGSVSISINALPVADAGINQTIPFGTSTVLNGSASGGFGTMSYSWTPLIYLGSGATTPNPQTTNLYSSTTFTLEVTDGKGCQGTDQVTVMLSGSALAVIATATPDEICADTSQSQLNAIVTGGSGSYTYSWTSNPPGSPVWTSMLQNPMVSPDVTTTYTVIANDGFNTAIASVTVVVNPLPLVYSITGGGTYCFGGNGVAIGLSGSETFTNYQLLRGGVPDGPQVTGTGGPISFGDRTAAFTYTAIAINNVTGCINSMSGSTSITIIPPPTAYLVTGGGSYPQGGIGVPVGLSFGDPGVSYQLYYNNVQVGAPVIGSGANLDFGLQLLAGTYTVTATDISTGCTANMNGSVSITILPLPNPFNVFGGGIICQGEPGLLVSLTGSEVGIHYQLIYNGFPSGPIVVGNGLILNWGPFTTAGIYEVRAINPTNGGTQMMNGQATITVNPLPTIFTINPTGSQCPGTIIRLNGSDLGVNYYLLMNGIVLDSLPGTGLVGFLDFGPQTITGVYTILAVNATTGCQAMMNDSTYINVAPQIFNVIPAGILCPGQTVSLTGSEVGVSYQLRWNGTFNLGSPVAGTGGPIDIGVGGLPGIYSAIAIDDSTNCVSYMQDSATLYPDPVIFTIVPNGVACEGDEIHLNGSELGVDYVLLLENAIHLDTLHGTGGTLNFGPQYTEGTYTIIAISQTSYCITAMNGMAVFRDSPISYDVVPAGVLCMGNTIGLAGSQPGVSYQLILNGSLLVGSPISGTGFPISFGPQNAIGTYTVRAINDTTNCYSIMNGIATLDPLPTLYTITPAGNHCPGTIIGLNGSDLNHNYILVFNGVVQTDTIAGTGGAISFGPQFTPGTYSVVAYNALSFCQQAMNGSIVLETTPTAYNMTPAGIACVGTVIGLENSEIGVSYQLRLNGTTNIGAPVAGTGSAISFGVQSTTGLYTVIATGANGCTAVMNGSVNIEPLPVPFTITPSGTACANTAIGLNGSELNVNYVLILDGTLYIDTIPGTGGMISFGVQSTTGTYTVMAYNTLTNCQQAMNGSVILEMTPTPYNMTPAGIVCVGTAIGLDDSEIGVSYQLRLNGTTNIGAPVAGTGSAISFGVQSPTGPYTVIATGANGCTSVMNGSVFINPLPVQYTITPASSNCVNTLIGLNGSEINANYILVLDGTTNLDTIPGTGNAISFGPQPLAGTYTILAYYTATNCQLLMNGSSVILVDPLVFNMTPTGIACLGAPIGLDDSETGVTYQLRLNGTTNVGSPVTGTGSAISFGSPVLPGTYTVIATSSNGCSTLMNGNVIISPLPIAYNITPAGTSCAGSPIGLNGSELNVNYVLILDGTLHIDTIPGTGGVISFGIQSTTGTYTVMAYNTLTNCQQTMNGSVVLETTPTAYNMTPAGIACVGSTIGLDNSEIGVSYQLRLNGTINIGAPVAGTGSAISFGAQSATGLYTVIATGANGCTAVMNGSVNIEPLPVPFTITPSGTACANTSIGLNGSELNVNYVLILDGTLYIDTIPGTGGMISFGVQSTTGTYTVMAYNTLTNCQQAMNGSVVLETTPTAYNMTPAGIACVGSAIGLDNSEIGVSYQLRLNGTTNIGAPVAGTGSAISFGVQSATGLYTVIATGANGCTAVMNGSVNIEPLPVPFTITPSGTACANTAIGLNGSELNVNYVLILDGTLYIDTIPGTGGVISFGVQSTTGTYTVMAYNTLTNCQQAMNGSVVLETTPTAYNMTPAGIACVGSIIGLDNSEIGVSYQLRLNGTTNIGASVAGTGSAISFGAQSATGPYTVIATGANGCTAVMNGSVNIEPLPVPFTITPSGTACANTAIGLNGSELNVNYILILDGTLYIDTIPGTGGMISFGVQSTTGTYTVMAYNTLTNCQQAMNGSVVLETTPTAYNMTPAGIACVGSAIGLDNSEIGVSYQLRLNGTTNIGAPVAGTGSAISFGVQSATGLYTVIATGANGCTAVMNGSVNIEPLPVPFTITPSGTACANTAIGLNGSELNVNYILILDGTLYIDTIPGTGGVVSFGVQSTTGTYTVMAYNTLTNCQQAMNGSVVLETTPTAYNMTPAGIACVGSAIGLDNSEIGVSYQLRLNGTTNIGAPVAGTGSAISFGVQSATGLYTVIATGVNGCTAVMNGSVNIEPLPVPFTITPSGTACANTAIGLNGSELNVNYILILDGTLSIDTIPGTGGVVSFGVQSTTGTYTVMAYNTLTNCQQAMNGSVVLETTPTAYNMTPAGIACVGSTIGLDNSEIGVSYQLRLNGTTNIGAPVAGTGSAISFGVQSATGLYTVIATGANGCTAVMNGSVNIEPLPVPFTITPSGTACANTAIGLNGSELNVNYVLILDGTLYIDTIPGTGGMISFGVQSTTGTYTVMAYNTLTNCQQAMNGSVILEMTPTPYNMTPAGIVCVGTAIGLDDSEIGVSYQLRLNGTTNIGAPVAGTGSAISFGVQSPTGPYTVIATGANGCTSVMNGSVFINPLPVQYTITPAGSNCVNTLIGLNGSELNVNYILVLDGTTYLDTIPGTGIAISFGPQPLAGNYTILAYNATTNCQLLMNGSSVILVDPLVFNMTPTGIACLGAPIGLDDSETGVTYQLRMNGTINVGSPVAGTGSAITFGSPVLPGTYTVVASSSNGCSVFMSGNVILSPLPIPFTITPSGSGCMGSPVGLNGSEPGVNYVLILDGTLKIDTIPGTGGAVSFGIQSTTGTYTVIAYNVLTNCQQAMNDSVVLKTAPTAFNMTPAGTVCEGSDIGLDNSEVGVIYQLRRDGIFNVGVPVSGTGSAISFGIQTLPGVYTVEASNGNGCIASMNGSIVLNPLPTPYTIMPNGNHCPGTIITLNGSQTGVDYVLMRDGLFPVDTLAGTGGVLNFGAPLIAGSYTLVGISSGPGCQSVMNGSTIILTAPIAFNVTPAGINCTGTTVGLDNSEVGVDYQLIHNGTTNVGTPLPGTGSPISFGMINIPGIYTVIGTNTVTKCPVTMNGQADIQPSPQLFTLNPQGIQCAGTNLTLNGSQIGVNYVLVIDGIFYADTLSGTGNPLNFGAQNFTGIYTILAIGGSSSCQAVMFGSCIIVPNPTLFNVTPAGLNCATAIVGLDGSEMGIEYTLYKDGISTGIILAGTGSAISFGLQSAGLYTIFATDLTTGCSIFMSGNAMIQHLPVVNAGNDQSVCSDQTVALNASSNYTGMLSWTTSGNGIFSDPSVLNPFYTLGSTDIASGSVMLIIEAFGTGACAASGTSDTMVVTITTAPAVNAGTDIEVCLDNDYTITGASASNYTTLLWTTSGTGNFTQSTNLITTYIPSAADLTAGSVNLTLTITGIAPCMNVISDMLVMTFHPFVTVNAGPDGIICAGSNYTVSGASAANYSAVNWMTLGSGSFTGGNTLTPTYFPSAPDIAAGSVTLVITATPVAPCSVTVSDTLVLQITPAPVINAGADVNICEGSVVNTFDATASSYSSLFWTTSGTGSFSSTTVLNPVYTPSAADIIAGTVTLTLTINGNTPCYPLSDDKVVTITRQPQISAGQDTLICEGMTYTTLTASASFYTNLVWTTSGSGSFANGNNVSATYTPSAADIAAGSVILTMTVDALAPCPGSLSDSFVLTINSAATVYAGPDASICDNIPFALSAATATSYTSVVWSTSGTGSFSNPTLVNPVYYPSTADLLSGSVVLTLSVTALSSCTDVTDFMVLNLTQLPQVNAGPNTAICTQPYTLAGTSSSNVTSVLWTVTNGTGTLTNANTLTPTFTPSAQDILNGFAVLTLTGSPISPCPDPAVDSVVLTIDQTPVVNAGADDLNCMDAIYTVPDATSMYQSTLLWTSSGTGTFMNATTLNASYTPSAADLITGSVVLTLTASNAGCGSVSDSKTLTFIGMPVVNAGPDMIICEDINVTIGGASASTYSSISWSTTGTGTFANGNTVSPTYTPSAADILSGSVTLTLTANAISPCGGTVADQAILTISRIPVVNAGADDLVCSTDSYVIADASSIDHDSVTWISSGTGIFGNPNSVATTYTPSAADIANGSVILTLTAYNMPCASVSDSKLLTIVMAPSVNAGPGATICSSCTYSITGASAPNSGSVLWTTYGSGSFSNPSILNPVYQPSAFDISQGYVILQLTANGNAPCDAVMDTMTLFISANPGIDFTWGPSCEGQPVPFQVNAALTNIGAIANWNWDFGDGSGSAMMNPSHLFPATGHYMVTLTATDTLGNLITNHHPVYVSEPPVAFFAYDSPVCSNQSVQFTDLSHTLFGNISEWIWIYGDGTMNDTIHFPDNPNITHLYDTAGQFSVTLVITNSFGCIASVTQSVDIIPAPVANFTYTNTCSGLNTQFEDASFANGSGNVVQWWWDFDDPGTGPDNFSNLENPEHKFSGPGTYHVKHVAINFNNCSDTIVKEVIILDGMNVDFVHHHTCVNDLSYFEPDTNAFNIQNVAAWHWDFGDGGYSYLQSPVHTYLNPGSYQVTLTVTGIDGCVSSKIKTVVVNPAPVALFNISQQQCKGIPVNFDDVSSIYAGYIVSWTWDFGDGNLETINFPANPDTEHTYATSGTYVATLTITASDSCSSSISQTLIIEPAPTANFEYDNNCQSSPVQFSDLSQTGGTGAISSWEWDFGDPISNWNNLSSLQNPVHTYSSAGVYPVSLTVYTANGCQSTDIQMVTIHPAPIVDFYTDAHCENNPVQFHPAPNVNSANVAAWFWEFGDGLTSTAMEPVHIYPAAGYYQVTLTITDINGCQNSISRAVHIIPEPTVIFNYTQPVCANSNVEFTSNASASVGYLVRWEWNFGDGTSQTIFYPNNPDVSHQYANYGTYNATLTVYTNDSCSNSQTRTITVLQSPLANFGYEGTCAGMGVQFDDLSQGNITSWHWNFGDPLSGTANISGFQNPVHTYNQAGNYPVTLLVNSANGCSDTLVKTVTINAAPAVEFSYNNGCASDTIQFNSSSFVNVASTSAWLWQFGDNSTSTQADPGHIYANPGTYSVLLTITDLNGCVNTKGHQVQVTAAPVALYLLNSNACSGSPIEFNDVSSTSGGTITHWVWDFGDGTITTIAAPSNPDISHIFTNGGTYTVSLTIHTSTGCEDTYTTNLVVHASPLAAYSYEGNCSGQVTSFTDLSQAAGGSIIGSWAWDFGDPASGINNTSSVPNPFHIYDDEGTYNVMLTVVNANGCADTSSQQLIIAPPPAVEFFTSQPTCDGSELTFQVDPAVVLPGTVSIYDWDFGDGSAHSNLAAPVHVYAAPGTYPVTLTITNTTGCENAITHDINIHSLPVPQFVTGMNCSGNNTQFNDISFSPDGSEIVAWHWDFGVASATNDTSNVQNPGYLYPSPGSYVVTLTITTTTGCSNTATVPVQIIPAPVAEYKFTPEPCHNGSVIFQDMSTSPQSAINEWLWEFRPGSYSTLRDPVYVFGYTDTTFHVKLIVTNAFGCKDTIVKAVYIPAGLEIAINNTETCHGETTWFTSNVVNPVGDSLISFKWGFGDPESGFSNISYLRNPSHTYSKAGTYVVSLEATDIHNCTSTVYRMINIAPLPIAQFTYSGGECDSLVNLTDKTTGAEIATWIWNYGDGAADTIQSPSNPDVAHFYTNPGIYLVSLTTISNGGCVNTIMDTVRRTPCISSAFVSTDTLVCQKKTMHFTDMSTCQAPIASWTWDFGDNTVKTFTSPQPVVSHTYTEAGAYTVRLTVATNMVGGAVTATSEQPVGVNPAPKTDFTWKDVCIGNETPFTNTTTGNGSQVRDYSWKFGDPLNAGATSSLKHPRYEYSLAGTYYVNLVSSNTIGCYDTIVKTISIFAPPQANFNWSNSCENKPVDFTDISDTASSAITSWNWYFSDEHSVLGASTQRNPSYDFSHAGLYNAKMITVDGNGCSDTITQQVAINASPVAVFSITENFENVQGQIKLNNGTVNGTGFLWDFGNGTTSYSEEPVIQYDRDGDYEIRLVTWNGQDCGDTVTMDYSFVFKGLYVPNAFAPENTVEGVTLFKPAGINLSKYYIEVLDRWGNLLWSTDKLDVKGSPVEGWDGTVNNNYLPAGVYVWRAKAIFRDGTYWDGTNIGNNDNLPQTFSGTVTLIR